MQWRSRLAALLLSSCVEISTKISKPVCLFVCMAMHFVLWGMERKVGIGVGDGPTRFENIFLKWPTKGQRSSRGQVNLEMPYGHHIWVGRTPDQSVFHWWGQMLCRGQPGSNYSGMSCGNQSLVGRTPDQSVVHWWVNQGSNYSGMPCGNLI